MHRAVLWFRCVIGHQFTFYLWLGMCVHVKQPVIKAVQKNGDISFLVDRKLNSADWTAAPFLWL